MLFKDPSSLPGTINTANPISVAGLNNIPYLFYRGSGSDTQVYYVANNNGNWDNSPKPVPNLKTQLGVTAVNYKGTIYVLVVEDGSAFIGYATFDGSSFSSVQQLPKTVNGSGTPFAYATSDGITVVYQGVDTTNLFTSVGSAN